MIRGTARRVIMVESPDPELFERAIFIMRDEAFIKKNMQPEEILRQAQRIADDYVRNNIKRKKFHIPPIVYAISGAGISAVICLLLYLFL